MADSSAPPPAAPRWFAAPRARWAAIAVLAAIVAIEGYVAVFVRANDVANHFHYGRRLLEPEAGAHPYHYWYVPYPAGRGVLNAALAWLPYHGFRAACYALGLASLAGALVLWERMARAARPASAGVPFAAAFAALILLSPWIVRDMDDCGLQLILLYMLTACLDLCRRGKSGWAGVWLGLAVVYKATPLLFIPVLAITGRWRAVATAGATALALSLSPVAFIGWDATLTLNEGFVDLMRASGKLGDPSENGFEPPRHQNQGLVVSLGRLLETYPPGHPLHLAHPLFVQFLDLTPATASRVAKAAVAAMLLYLVVWCFGRRSWLEGREADVSREGAALLGLCALLSPMCWVQHLVLCLPAAYLLLRDAYGRLAERSPVWRPGTAGLIAAAVLIFAFSREVTGRELSIVFLSYKVNTLAALVLVGVTLALPRTGAESVGKARARRLGRSLSHFGFARPSITGSSTGR